MTKPLNQDWILRVHEGAISAALSNNRDALLATLDEALVSRLSLQDDLSAQILSDLGRLNVYGPKNEPLDNAPIAIWLKNAIALTQGQEECSVFEEALQNLRPRTEPTADSPEKPEPHPPPPPSPPSKPPWPLFLAIALIAAIGGGIAYLTWPPKGTTITQSPDGGSTTQTPDAGKVKPPGPDAGPKPGTDGGTSSGKPDAGVNTYCQEPPAYIEGTVDLAFGFNQEDAEAKKTITAMKEMLAPFKKNGPAWSGAITRGPSLTGGISRTLKVTRWDVYFNDVDKGVGICEWLDKCKDFHTCKARITIMAPAPLHSIDTHKLLLPEKQP